MQELDLTAEEDQAPQITPIGFDNLWYQKGWVRGRWQAGMQATDPSGTCGVFVGFGDTLISLGKPETPNRHTWKQCLDQGAAAAADTTTAQGSLGIGEGAVQLRFSADNAAGNHAELSKAVYVDNSTPTVSLSGPTDAPSTAGAQYVTASAGGSPSGIEGISCTTDGGPPLWFWGATAQVPVAGIGEHSVSCAAADNAADVNGDHGWSARSGWWLKIGQPTLLGVSFNRVVDALHCRRTRVRTRISGRWVTVYRHRRPVWVWISGRVKTTTVTRCHPQTVTRRTIVWITVRRGHRLVRVRRTRVVKVVVPPHVARGSVRRVSFGHATKINGWLGTSGGNALPGQIVRILSAPDDGQSRFATAAVALSGADGSWTASLPAGPSRVIEAVYDGNPSTEPSFSATAHVLVPAEIRISVRPTVVPWGGRLRITGQVLGGHIPPGSNVLKLLFGDGPKPHTIGTPEVQPDGRFSIPIAWSAGHGVVRYWFAVATLSEADYPYIRSTSRRVAVRVGS